MFLRSFYRRLALIIFRRQFIIGLARKSFGFIQIDGVTIVSNHFGQYYNVFRLTIDSREFNLF